MSEDYFSASEGSANRHAYTPLNQQDGAYPFPAMSPGNVSPAISNSGGSNSPAISVSRTNSGPNSVPAVSPGVGAGGGAAGAAAGAAVRRERGRVRFNSNSEVNDETNKRSSLPLRDVESFQLALPKPAKTIDSREMSGSLPHNPTTPENERQDPFLDEYGRSPKNSTTPVRKTRPSVLRNNSYNSEVGTLPDVHEEDSEAEEKAFSALAAQERAQRIASLVGSHSAPASRRNSVDDAEGGGTLRVPADLPVRIDDIPLVELNKRFDTDSDDEEDERAMRKNRHKNSSTSEAHKLVTAHTRKTFGHSLRMPLTNVSGLVSGQVTPVEEKDLENYVPRPEQYRGGVLSSLLKLYKSPEASGHQRLHSRTASASDMTTGSPSQPPTPGSSGTNTPRSKHSKWYHHKSQSHETLAGLIEASAILGAPGGAQPKRSSRSRPPLRRPPSSKFMGMVSRPRLEDEIHITVHIAETLSRQKYLIKLCRALMAYGAPTHRLEEYLKMSARVLEIDGQFLYIPGTMIISFDDISTHTTEVKIVRVTQGVDLGKLKDVHEIYKEVVHDVIGVEEAIQRLDTITTSKDKHNPWLRVLVYGLASASVAPFAFEGRLIDLPFAFFLGCFLGFLQLIVAPRSDLYSNVFEISAAVLTSFLARAFGSIGGGNIFCFSALAQSSIALILPGYLVLCSALELQSRSIVAGSVRMVYAIIYSLFLGFGITVGTAVYGIIDSSATSATTCTNPLPQYYRFFFVPCFTLCLAIINQSKWKQVPVMLIISMAGYTVNFFSAKVFPSSAQISNTLGALIIGILGNLYSRVRHGVAAAALLPAIFVQVPSGLAASGSLLAGLSTADELTNNTSTVTGTSSVTITSGESLDTVVFNVAYSMIQIAIGITVGLFLSALIVYPFGKRRSGLFSF